MQNDIQFKHAYTNGNTKRTESLKSHSIEAPPNSH